MDTARFDHLTRSVSTVLSRRTLAGALGLGALALPGLADAKKRKKKKKIKRNAFGCVNVGGFCKNAGQCCSGICTGKKGRKKCKAHDTGGCQASQDFCTAGDPVPCTTGANLPGQCVRTTGNASYCEAIGECFPCSRDTDCEAACGAAAACIVCEVLCGPGGTACVGLSTCDFT